MTAARCHRPAKWFPKRCRSEREFTINTNQKRSFALFLAASIGCLALVTGSAFAESNARSGFDHFTTGWPLDGAHRRADCESCHVAGIFKGTPRQCVACHSQAGLVKATPVPLKHIRSTTQCQECHREASWAPVFKVDHTQVLGSCRSCHNNMGVAGKPPDHPTASNQCELCHRTNTWLIIALDAPESPANTRVAATTKIPPTGDWHFSTASICAIAAIAPAAECR